MSFYHKKSAVNYVQQLETLAANANNKGVLLYKLDVTGPKYETYIQNCNGIKEVMMYKKPTTGTYISFAHFYYCDILKTKTSSVRKDFNGQYQFFLTRQDAEEAFAEVQRQSAITLEKRLQYYQDLLDNVKQMSV